MLDIKHCFLLILSLYPKFKKILNLKLCIFNLASRKVKQNYTHVHKLTQNSFRKFLEDISSES